jgi:ABC-2 type transport system ATP-binding protein
MTDRADAQASSKQAGAMRSGTPTAVGVELIGLTKRFDAVTAVDGVDVAIAPGEVVALLGPNGAGKTTTIDMLLGLIPPDAGSVRLWGRPPREACAAGYVGAMLQSGGLLGGLTTLELVELMRGLSPDPLPTREVLEMARVAEFADQRADRLSGGQTQRVRFALAIAGDPQLLVLDEPTVAMDVATRRGFWAVMHDWTSQGRTVLFATHYLEEADAFADRAILMAHGKVVADGPTAEVKASVGLRVVRATVRGAGDGELAALPGVTSVERRGDVITLRTRDSDQTLRALLVAYDQAHDLEVTGAGLEDAFLALTGNDAPGGDAVGSDDRRPLPSPRPGDHQELRS